MANLKDFLKLCRYKITAEPLWGSDAGRENMKGTYTGTFKGYFTTITLNFGKTTQDEMKIIKQTFEKPTFSFTYPSDIDGNDTTETFYATAISSEKESLKGKYLPFEITLVATEGRT